MNKNKNNIPLSKDIDALVDYIDKFMSKENAGHINIKVNNGDLNKEELYVDNTGNCCQSCYKVPNLFEGLDNNEESED